MNRAARSALLVVLLCCVGSSAAVGLAAADPGSDAVGVPSADAAGLSATDAAAGSDAGGAAGFATAVQGNGSDEVLHERPERVADSGDPDAVASWLAGTLVADLNASASDLRAGDYDAARSVVEGPYRDRLGQYEAIAGQTSRETESESDPRTRDEVAAQEFRAISEAQVDLTELLAEHEETYAAYQNASEQSATNASEQNASASGDEERTVALARELVSITERAESLVAELRERHGRVERLLDHDLSEPSDAAATVAADRREVADEAASEAFVDTELRVQATDATGSADDPIVVVGQLLDDSGDPISGATVATTDPVRTVADGAGAEAGRAGVGSGGTTTVQTNEDGVFRLQHRVGFVPTGEQELVLEYRPDRSSPYRTSSAPVSVSFERTDGELDVESDLSSIRYGDEISVRVSASTANGTVAGVPVRLRVGGDAVTGTTNGQGTVRLATTVPRDVPDGERDLQVSVPLENWSVAFEEATVPVTVRSTESTLTAEVVSATDGPAVGGQLQTSYGTPVADAPIEIEVDGPDEPTTATVRTDEDGWYRRQIDASADSTVTATYDESDANLQRASATATVSESAASGGDGGLLGGAAGLSGLASSRLLPIGLGAALLGVVAVGAGVLRRRTGADDDAELDLDADEIPGDLPVDEAAPDGDPIAAAKAAIPEDTTRATVFAYGVGRSAVDESVRAPRDATHREFLSACESADLDSDVVAALRELTEYYEEAAYAPGDVDETTARMAIEAAERLQGARRPS